VGSRRLLIKAYDPTLAEQATRPSAKNSMINEMSSEQHHGTAMDLMRMSY
jgi:hypothetical protein